MGLLNPPPRSKTYDDPEDVFEREPFAVQFKTNCVEEGGGDAGTLFSAAVRFHDIVVEFQNIS